MLRKRSRSHQKEQHMNNIIPDAIPESYFHSDITQKHKNNSFLKVPGLFVGFNPSSDSDSVRSPTSPLDFRIFSSFGNPFRCAKSQNESNHKSWACSKVGLSIIESLDDDTKQLGKATGSSENKNILLGRQICIRCSNFCSHVNSQEKAPKSLPKDVAVFRAKPTNLQKGSSDVVFEIGEDTFESESNRNFRSCSMDSVRYGSYLTNFGNRKSRLGSGNFVLPDNKKKPTNLSDCGFNGESIELGNSSECGLVGSIPASEIELSEDYTCVRTHGPNPKVTHIFGDRILDCQSDNVTDFLKDADSAPEAGGQLDILASYPPNDFLKFCYSCQKKLDGEDIYMYRGEKAFCSYSCRLEEIEIDAEMEKTNNKSSEISDKSNGCEEAASEGSFFVPK